MRPGPNLHANVLLRSEETDGQMSVTEIVVPPGGGRRCTHDFDEAFYMLEGELIFQVEDALVTKGTGELSFAPRMVAHALANHNDAPRATCSSARPPASSGTGRGSPPRQPASRRRSGHCSRSRNHGRRPADRGAGLGLAAGSAMPFIEQPAPRMSVEVSSRRRRRRRRARTPSPRRDGPGCGAPARRGALRSLGHEADVDLARLVVIGLDLPLRADVPAERGPVGRLVHEHAGPAALAAVDAAVVDVAADARLEDGLGDRCVRAGCAPAA